MNGTGQTEICAQVCRKCKEDWITIYLNPRKIVDRAEGCVMVAAVFMIILAIGTPRRRQSQSIIIRYSVEGVFILSLPFLSYTLGLMHGQVIKSELYPVWGMFLAMLFGGTNGMSVQKLDENKQSMKLYCDYLLFMFYLGLVFSIFFQTKLPYIGYVVMAVIFLLAFGKLEQWSTANLASKPSSDNGIMWLARYMKREHQLSTSYDPRTLQGFKYPVLIHAGSGRIGGGSPITLEEIWSNNMGALSSSSSSPPMDRLKDLCLSFALFHLVVRRYFGYTCPESKLDKSRDLVLDGLLATEQGYGRAFQVIEAELAFLYDFFFTKYAYIMYGREIRSCILSLAVTFVSIAVGAWAISSLELHTPHSVLDNHLVETSRRDVVVTKISFAVLSIFQLLQIWSYCVSDWVKVSFVCKYATHPSWQGNAHIEKLLLLFGRPHRWLRYWRNTIGQYSVLDHPLNFSWWDRLKQRFHLIRKAGKSVEVTMEVKRAIAHTIKRSIIHGRLSHGASALMRHGMSDQLHWACQIGDEFTVTHSILVWHVATRYCEISEEDRRRTDETFDVNDNPNQVVATSLSRYCAYLIAFAPTLLPGSPVEAECTLDELVKEAKETLGNLVSPREKHEKLIGLYNSAEPRQTMSSAWLLRQGVMLGAKLENRTTRWDLLADFWAEMLVYIAPSDNVSGHIELLAQGGEFVTHIWALLMHAGILERPIVAAASSTAIP